jgi:nicotinic acid mononucleotide adenylyltransferase
VEFFDMEPVPISSSDIRRLVAEGEPIGELVPPAVAEEIERLGLYRPRAGVS